MHRQVFQRWIEAELATRRVPYITLAGDIGALIDAVERVIAGFDRFRPLGETLLETGSRQGADPNRESIQ